MIQGGARGRLARLEARRLDAAAHSLARSRLQALVRGETARSVCQIANQVMVWDASTRLQAQLRRKVEAARVSRLKVQHASTIQAGLSGMLDRGIVELGLERDTQCSASRIIAAERGRRTRAEAKRWHDERHHYEVVADDSARTLQAGLLGRQGRGVAKDREAAAMLEEAHWELARDQARVEVRDRARGILRGRQARKAAAAIEVLQGFRSMSRLRALARGFQGRVATRTLLAQAEASRLIAEASDALEAADNDARLRSDARKLQASLYADAVRRRTKRVQRELCSSATRIRAHLVGRVARRRVQEMPEETAWDSAAEARLGLARSARAIQSAIRGKSWRGHVQAELRFVERKARLGRETLMVAGH